jgi:hypothetical protein
MMMMFYKISLELKQSICSFALPLQVSAQIQGDSRSFPVAYSTYSSEYFVQNSLINLWSIFNSYGVKLDFGNASL